ncbi:MAG: hypothetical protein WD602_10395 [Actinomycetota bacterium]
MLLGIAAIASPEWPRRAEILALPKVSFDTAQGRLLFGLVPFGVALGIPAALGLISANVLALLSAMIACMLGRDFLAKTHDEHFGWTPAHGWFAVLSWSVLALPLHVNSLDLQQVVAAQTALGPAPLYFGAGPSAAFWLAMLAGLVAAAGWSQDQVRLPTITMGTKDSAADMIARWGESALAATAVTSILWGPSLGALVSGPINERTVGFVALSFVVTCAAVAAVSFARRFITPTTQLPLAAGAGAVAALAMLLAAFVQ